MSEGMAFVFYVIEHLSGIAIIIYRSQALQNAWPMGTMYAEPSGASPIKLLGLAAILHSLVGAFIQLGWGYALGLLAIGFVFNWPVVRLLGPSTQVVCPLAALVSAGFLLFS